MMGQRGPTPTPTAILSARGSWRANGRPQGPEALSEVPEPPADMRESAKQLWFDLGQQLVGMGVLSEPYLVSFRLTVECIDNYRLAYAEAMVTPFTFEHEKAGTKESPIHKIADRSRSDCLRWLARWGLTPSDSTSVIMSRQEKPGGLSNFSLSRTN